VEPPQEQLPSSLFSSIPGSLLSGLTVYVPETETVVPVTSVAAPSPVVTNNNNNHQPAPPEPTPLPTTTPPQDDQQRIVHLRSSFVQSSAEFATALERADAQLAAKAQERAQCEKTTEKLLNDIATWETEQNEAMAKEDFDKAQSLQEQVDKARKDVSGLVIEAEKLRRETQALEMQREAVFSNELGEIEKFVDELEQVSDSQSAKAQAITRQAETEISQSSRRLDEQQEELRVQSEQLATELSVATAEVTQVNERIAQGTAELRVEQEEWQGKVSKVDAEIAELEKQLALKREERDEYAGKLGVAVEEIAKFSSKYSARLSTAETQVKACEDKLARVTHAADKVQEQRRAVEARVQEQEAKTNALQASVRMIKLDLSVLESVKSRMKREAAGRRRKQAELSSEDRAVQGLRDLVLAKRAEVEQNLGRLDGLVRALEKARAEADGSVVKELEAQKAVAVGARNFKEAGRLASEIKTWQGRQSELQVKVDECAQALEQGRAGLQRGEQELVEAQRSLEHKVSMVEKEKEKDLEVQLQSVESAVSDLRELDLNDDVVKAALALCDVEEASLRRKLGRPKGVAVQVVVEPPPPQEQQPEEQQPEQQEEEVINASNNKKEEEEAVVEAAPQVEEEAAPSPPELSAQELERLLEEAIANEDFEAAEVLNSRLEAKLRQ
jgi:hypothetical protein